MDSFFPTNLKEIIATLMPFSVLMRKTTYHHFNSRCPATLIAKGLLKPEEPKPLLLRYFLGIQRCKQWVNDLLPLKFKFEPHLDGPGVRMILRSACPEKLIWEHFDYVRRHY
jgi:hypothetical protein